MFYRFIVAILLLQGCSIIPKEKINCATINHELNARYSLFENLSEDEITKRQMLDVETLAAFDKLSVVSKIVAAVKSAAPNAKLIPVDLRYYNDVSLGNVIISNLASKASLPLFLKTSKFSQGFFTLINLNQKSVNVIVPRAAALRIDGVLEDTEIARGDLSEAELVFNVSDANNIGGNMKFSQNQKVSIIADRVKNPYRLDVREAENLQFYLNQQWIMSVYSIEDSALIGGKNTTGLFRFVNNKNVREIKLHRFSKSDVSCYLDPLGRRFGDI